MGARTASGLQRGFVSVDVHDLAGQEIGLA
jgi:hypothetical protein